MAQFPVRDGTPTMSSTSDSVTPAEEVEIFDRYFISPHPDDIAFSAFGSLTNPPVSRSLIITVFDNSRFSFLPNLDQQETTRIRKTEDQGFAQLAGCRLMSLDLPDSSVRCPQEGLEYQRKPGDDDVTLQVSRTLENHLSIAACRGAPVYVPLGNSEHLDHLIVRDAVIRIYKATGNIRSVFFYEDLPYASNWNEPDLRHYAQKAVGPAATPLLVDISSTWNQKLQALKLYSSQIEATTIPAIKRHANTVTKGRSLAERLWYLPSDEQQSPRVVDTVAWVSWEACRLIGGCGVALSSIIGDPEYQYAVERTLLIGPMYMPRDCIEYGPDEDIEQISASLDAPILYRSYRDGHDNSVSCETVRQFREIESRHGVEIAYLRDNRLDHHVVERLLFNFAAAVLPKHIYSPSLQHFLGDLYRNFGLDLRLDLVRERSVHASAHLIMDTIRRGNPFDNGEYNAATKQRIDQNRSKEYGHVDNDYIYRVCLAQPAADGLQAVLQRNENCVLVVQEYMSLPTAYAVKLDPGKYPTISTLYFAGEVRPICGLVEGHAEPNPIDATFFNGDFAWEAPIRSLVNFTNHINGTQMIRGLDKYESRSESCSRLGFLDFPEFQHLSKWASTKIIQHGWKLDRVMPVSSNVLEELLFFDRGYSFSDEQKHSLFYHGTQAVACTAADKKTRKQLLLRYAAREWKIPFSPTETSEVVVLSRVARAVGSKAMYRDITVVKALGEELPNKRLLLVIVTRWSSSENPLIDDLLSMAREATAAQPNAFIKLVNAFSWPSRPEAGYGVTFLARDDIHRAADINLCLSSYDSYNLAALEGLSCGSLAVMSTSCGAARRVQRLKGFERNIILANYAADFQERVWKEYTDGNPIPERKARCLSTIFGATRELKDDIENRVARSVAQAIVKSLPRTLDEVEKLIESGTELAKTMSWTTEIRDTFIPCLDELVKSQTHPA